MLQVEVGYHDSLQVFRLILVLTGVASRLVMVVAVGLQQKNSALTRNGLPRQKLCRQTVR
jgi:hypothetical protein